MNNFSAVSVVNEFEDEFIYDEDTTDTDSDEIDSDIEFHLYSQVHYASTEYENDNDKSCETENTIEGDGKNEIEDVFCENLLEPISDDSDIGDNVDGEINITEVNEYIKVKSRGKTIESFNKDDLTRLRNHLSESSETDFVPESWEIVDSVDDEDSDDAGLDIHISDKIDDDDVVEEEPNEAWIPGKGPKSCWKIDDSDKKVFSDDINSKGRYYGGPSKASRMRCHNCSETGHKAVDCPDEKKVPACFVCGVRGHVGRNCPEKDGLKQRGRSRICNRCELEGHIQVDCPDHWRQFHVTTKPGPIVIPNIPIKLKEDPQCYNCAGYGHFGHECENDRFQLYHFVLPPFVHRYDSKTVVQIPQDLRRKLPRKRLREVSPERRKTRRERNEEEYTKAKSDKSKNNHIIFRSPSPKRKTVSKEKRHDKSKNNHIIFRSPSPKRKTVSKEKRHDPVNVSQYKGKLKNHPDKNSRDRKYDQERYGASHSQKRGVDRSNNESLETGHFFNKKSQKFEKSEVSRDDHDSKNFLRKNRNQKKEKFVDHKIISNPSANANLSRFDERVVSFGNHSNFGTDQRHEKNHKPGRTVTLKTTEEEQLFPRNLKHNFENDHSRNQSRSRSFKKNKFDNRTRFNGDRGFRRHFS